MASMPSGASPSSLSSSSSSSSSSSWATTRSSRPLNHGLPPHEFSTPSPSTNSRRGIDSSPERVRRSISEVRRDERRRARRRNSPTSSITTTISSTTTANEDGRRRDRSRTRAALATLAFAATTSLGGPATVSAAATARRDRHSLRATAKSWERRQRAGRERNLNVDLNDFHSNSNSNSNSNWNDWNCPRGYTGYHPTSSCRSYYWCRDGSPAGPIFDCGRGLLFDIAKGFCNWERDVPCSRDDGGFDDNFRLRSAPRAANPPSEEAAEIPGDSGAVPQLARLEEMSCPPGHDGYGTSASCQTYFWCDGTGSPPQILYHCDDGLLFDSEKKLCEWADAVSCNDGDGGSGGIDAENLPEEEARESVVATAATSPTPRPTPTPPPTKIEEGGVVVVTLQNNVTVKGEWGPPVYFPDNASFKCRQDGLAEDAPFKPDWLTENQMFSSKEQCCRENFLWVLDDCVGEGFVEWNFFGVITSDHLSSPEIATTAPTTTTTTTATTVGSTTNAAATIAAAAAAATTSARPASRSDPPDTTTTTSVSSTTAPNADAVELQNRPVPSDQLLASESPPTTTTTSTAAAAASTAPDDTTPTPQEISPESQRPQRPAPVSSDAQQQDDTNNMSLPLPPPPRPPTDNQNVGSLIFTNSPQDGDSGTSNQPNRPAGNFIRDPVANPGGGFLDPVESVVLQENAEQETEPEENEGSPIAQSLQAEPMNAEPQSSNNTEPISGGSTALEPINSASSLPADSSSTPISSSSPPNEMTVVIAATADATLSESNPYKNYGSHPQLVVDGGGGMPVNGSGRDTHFDALIKFDVTFLDSGLGLPITKVLLRLYVTDGASFGGTFQTLANTWWDEHTVTWESAPSGGNGIVIGVARNVVSGTWFELDVTGALNWARNDSGFSNPDSVKALSVRISSQNPENRGVRAIYSSLQGDKLLAPHLQIHLDASQIPTTTTAATSTSTSTSAATTTTPNTVEVEDEPEPEALSEQVPPNESVVLLATDDATISKSFPNDNFGLEQDITVSSSQDFIIRFDLQSLQHSVPKTAVLAMFAQDSCETAGVFTSTPGIKEWTEDSVTWYSSPSLRDGPNGALVGTFHDVTKGQWIGFDVISALSPAVMETAPSVTFRVTSFQESACTFGSIQSGKAPKLMLGM
mmetsp:Transcript_2720/g.5873  ORF Transcript_2720/g.5873 Transcript_2720/m.5873 type:complete len:1151 (+) Transcript_2720:226-3678(+)